MYNPTPLKAKIFHTKAFVDMEYNYDSLLFIQTWPGIERNTFRYYAISLLLYFICHSIHVLTKIDEMNIWFGDATTKGNKILQWMSWTLSAFLKFLMHENVLVLMLPVWLPNNTLTRCYIIISHLEIRRLVLVLQYELCIYKITTHQQCINDVDKSYEYLFHSILKIG